MKHDVKLYEMSSETILRIRHTITDTIARLQTYVLAFLRGPGFALCFGTPFASRPGADLFVPGAGPLRLVAVGVGASSFANGNGEGSTSTSGAVSIGRGVSTSSFTSGVGAAELCAVAGDCRASSCMAIG